RRRRAARDEHASVRRGSIPRLPATTAHASRDATSWRASVAERRALRRVWQRAPAALGDLYDAAPDAEAGRRERGLGPGVRLLHVDPRGRARVVLLDLVVRFEARRALGLHVERGSTGDPAGWRAGQGPEVRVGNGEEDR